MVETATSTAEVKQETEKDADVKAELDALKKQLADLRMQSALSTFDLLLSNLNNVKEVNVLGVEIPNADVDTLRTLADKFRETQQILRSAKTELFRVTGPSQLRNRHLKFLNF